MQRKDLQVQRSKMLTSNNHTYTQANTDTPRIHHTLVNEVKDQL